MKLIMTDNVFEIGEVVTDIIYEYKENKLKTTIALGKTNPKMKILESIKNSILNEEINFKYDELSLCDEQEQYKDLYSYFACVNGVSKADVCVVEMDEFGNVGLNKESTDFRSTIHDCDGIKTLGMKDLLNCVQLIVVASGPKVAKMVEFVLDSEEDPKVPATVLPSFDNVILIVDKLAGKYIKEEK